MIEVRNLHKRFDAQPVLDGVSFRIENGESVAIIGRSGCGKSVLIKHLISINADSGRDSRCLPCHDCADLCSMAIVIHWIAIVIHKVIPTNHGVTNAKPST